MGHLVLLSQVHWQEQDWTGNGWDFTSTQRSDAGIVGGGWIHLNIAPLQLITHFSMAPLNILDSPNRSHWVSSVYFLPIFNRVEHIVEGLVLSQQWTPLFHVQQRSYHPSFPSRELSNLLSYSWRGFSMELTEQTADAEGCWILAK